MEAVIRKILLLMLIALPVLAAAQSYSRWNYSDSQPNNAAADAAVVATIVNDKASY